MNTSNLPQTSDWHKTGLYVVIDPNGDALPATLETTGYSARSTFIHEYGLTWSVASGKGYRIVELTPSAQLVRKDSEPLSDDAN